MPAEEQQQEAASVLDQKADAVSRMYPASSSTSSSTSTSTSTKQQLWRRRTQDEALGGDQTRALGGTRSQCPGQERGEKPKSQLLQHESNEETAGG